MKASLSFPESCNEEVKGVLIEFCLKNYPRFSFHFQTDSNVDEPTLESLEAKEGAFGSIEGDSNLAAQAQMSGIQDEISLNTIVCLA